MLSTKRQSSVTIEGMYKGTTGIASSLIRFLITPNSSMQTVAVYVMVVLCSQCFNIQVKINLQLSHFRFKPSVFFHVPSILPEHIACKQHSHAVCVIESSQREKWWRTE